MRYTWTVERIKALRKRLGLTQGQFASFVGVARCTVSRWENQGQAPTALAQQRLAWCRDCRDHIHASRREHS